MKLIDLLVQELPKRGGWPANTSYIAQDEESATWGFRYKPEKDSDDEWMDCSDSGYEIRIGYIGDADDCNTSVVTREQYESALAASQKKAWNGEGLPPVGCECEYLDNNGKWYPVTVKYASDQLVVISGVIKILGEEQETEIAKDIITDKPQFRPLRTEAERKRDAAVEQMMKFATIHTTKGLGLDLALSSCYDAIAAGKIPGVKLED